MLEVNSLQLLLEKISHSTEQIFLEFRLPFGNLAQRVLEFGANCELLENSL